MKTIKGYECAVCGYSSEDISDVRGCCEQVREKELYECNTCGEIYSDQLVAEECEIEHEFEDRYYKVSHEI